MVCCCGGVCARLQVNTMVARRGAGVLEDFKAALTSEVGGAWCYVWRVCWVVPSLCIPSELCQAATAGASWPLGKRRRQRRWARHSLAFTAGGGGARGGGGRAVLRLAGAEPAAAA